MHTNTRVTSPRHSSINPPRDPIGPPNTRSPSNVPDVILNSLCLIILSLHNRVAVRLPALWSTNTLQLGAKFWVVSKQPTLSCDCCEGKRGFKALKNVFAVWIWVFECVWMGERQQGWERGCKETESNTKLTYLVIMIMISWHPGISQEHWESRFTGLWLQWSEQICPFGSCC